MKKLSQFSGAVPFFCAVFLNAFVDLGHKIVIQNTVFKLYDGPTQVVLTAIVNGLILLPFLLLLSPAGFLSDRFSKPRVMQLAAWLAVILCAGITTFYYLGWFELAFAMTFLLAAQSAIYSPAKLGFIKELFGKERLGQANGVVSALSIIAILAGIFAFSILFEVWFPKTSAGEAAHTDSGILQAIAPIGWVLLACAIVELIMMYRLPNLAPQAADRPEPFNWGRWLSGRLYADDLKPLGQSRVIRLSVIGLAMFWSVGQVMLAAFPAFLKEKTGVDNTIWVQGVLACAGLGIALGSVFAGRMSRDHIETGFLPIGACGIALGLLILPHTNSLALAALTFFWIGTMGGLFIVPLNALIQFTAASNALGKTLAANNWVQNVGMLSFLLLTVVFSSFGWSSESLLNLIAWVAVAGGLYTIYQLPQSLTRFLLTWVLSRHYKLQVQGIKNLPAKGGVLLLGNHISWIDWAILQLASPRPIRFVMIKNIYSRWYLTWFFDLFGCIPIEQGPRSREALKTVAEKLNAGDVVCLFPEGTISRTGHLAEFRRGFEKACEEVNDEVVIVPFYLRGLWGSQFSRSSERLRKQQATGMQRDLVIAFGNPMPKNSTTEQVKQRVLDVSIHSWQEYAESLPTLPQQWVRSAKRHASLPVVCDTLGTDLNGLQALTGSALFAKRIKKYSRSQTVGLLLPTTAGAMICNMATLLAGKILVNLNYTAGAAAMLSAIEQAKIDTVYTSEKFLRKLEAKGIDVEQLKSNANLIYVEDVKNTFSPLEKAGTLIACKLLPTRILQRWLCSSRRDTTQALDSTAAIVFSSGTEGTPKGIQLSHKNIMANVKQVSDVLNMEANDVMLANLPLFHAFGLTAAQFLPLLEGIPVVAHPDPTDALGSAKAIAKHNATIMFGTTTFLRMYIRNRKIHPLMLSSMRLIVAGAERLTPEVRDQFNLKFNKDIYEGYGATETTPVASVNLPDRLSEQDWKVQLGQKRGTVGMPLPGSSFKIVDPHTFTELNTGESGMILLGGCQVMQGYLNQPDKTDAVIKHIDGTRWYVTGDKGRLDEDGFLTIEDRYSRFAKIGGEMIPLGKIEHALQPLLPVMDETEEEVSETVPELIAVNIPDAAKGEKIVLLTTIALTAEQVRTALSEAGLPSLANPASIIPVDHIPKLGSGKTDFGEAKRVAQDQ